VNWRLKREGGGRGELVVGCAGGGLTVDETPKQRKQFKKADESREKFHRERSAREMQEAGNQSQNVCSGFSAMNQVKTNTRASRFLARRINAFSAIEPKNDCLEHVSDGFSLLALEVVEMPRSCSMLARHMDTSARISRRPLCPLHGAWRWAEGEACLARSSWSCPWPSILAAWKRPKLNADC